MIKVNEKSKMNADYSYQKQYTRCGAIFPSSGPLVLTLRVGRTDC